MKSNSFIATPSGAVLAAFLALASATASAQDSLIRELSFFGTSATRSEVALPSSVPQQLGRGDCSTVVQRYSATESQLIVHIGKRPQSCDFEDLQFLFNGKYYPLDGIESNLVRSATGNYEWPPNASANTMFSFNIGTRLAKDALTTARGPYGVVEQLCPSISDNCLTASNIPAADVGHISYLLAPAAITPSTNNANIVGAQLPMKRYTAQRIQKNPSGDRYFPQAVNERCDFFYPDVNNSLVQKLNQPSGDRRVSFVWYGSCAGGLLQGANRLNLGEFRGSELVGFSGGTEFPSVAFTDGRQVGGIRVGNGLLESGRIDVGGGGAATINAIDFLGKEQLIARRYCAETGWAGGCLREANDDALFGGGIVVPGLALSGLRSCASPRNASVEICKWAESNESAAAQSASTLANRGDCVNLRKHVSDAWEKGRVNLNSLEATCESTAKFNTALAIKDAQSMFLAGTRYESEGERGRAKTIYNNIMNRFPKSIVAGNAGTRLASLASVEAAEAAGSRAADASARSADLIKNQNYDQCMLNYSACRQRCSPIRNYSLRTDCESSCAYCYR